MTNKQIRKMQLGYWLINTAGIGGLVVTAVGVTLLIVYARMLWWIHQGGEVADAPGGEGDAPH